MRIALVIKFLGLTAVGATMTEQYLIGELSQLIGDFGSVPDEFLQSVLLDVRRSVEQGSTADLPMLAREAMGLAELLCMTALARCDARQFNFYLAKAAALDEFVVSAGLAA